MMKDATDRLHKFYMRQIEDHMKTFNPENEPTDYVEAFLKEKAKKEAEGETNHYFVIPQLLGMCYDFWLAGQHTTNNTLGWGVLYLMLEQKVQKTMQQELDEVVGSDRLITIEDKPNLNYTQAVVTEIQRIANLLPNNGRCWSRSAKNEEVSLPRPQE